MKFTSIMKVVRPLLTLLEYAVSVLIIAVTAQVAFGSNLQTYIITAISIFLAVSTYAVWFMDGKERGERTDAVYNTTLRFHTYARAISNKQLMDKQKEFCLKKNEEHRLELIKARLSEYELKLDDLTEFKENLKEARSASIRAPKLKIGSIVLLYKTEMGEKFALYCKKYTKAQLKVLRRLADRKIKCDTIEPKDLTSSISTTIKSIKPTNKENKGLPLTLIGKIVWGVLLGIFTMSIVFTRKDHWTINETIQVVVWGFSISYNIYSSIVAGYKSVVIDRFNYYKAKIELCTEFFGFVDISPENIEKEEHLQDKLHQTT